MLSVSSWSCWNNDRMTWVTKWPRNRVTKWPSDWVTGCFADDWPYGIFQYLMLPNIHKRHFSQTLTGCYFMSIECCHCGDHCISSWCVVSRPVRRRPSSLAQCCTEVIEDDSRLKTAAIWHRWIIVICFPRDSIEASRAFLITNSFLNTNHPPRTVLTILLSSWKFKL